MASTLTNSLLDNKYCLHRSRKISSNEDRRIGLVCNEARRGRFKRRSWSRLVVRNGTTSKRIEQTENQKRNGTAQVAKMLPPPGQKRPPRLRKETKKSMAASDGQKHTSEDPPRTKLGLLRLSRWSKHTMICTTTKARTPEDPSETETRKSEDHFSLKHSREDQPGHLRF